MSVKTQRSSSSGAEAHTSARGKGKSSAVTSHYATTLLSWWLAAMKRLNALTLTLTHRPTGCSHLALNFSAQDFTAWLFC